jgi:hypothetical protein
LGRIRRACQPDIVIVQKRPQDLRHFGIVLYQQDSGRRRLHSLAVNFIMLRFTSTAILCRLSTFNTNFGPMTTLFFP